MLLTSGLRSCIRRGCSEKVKKPTAKYCSVRCCAVDPERRERLRSHAGRNPGKTVLPMARQLSMGLTAAGGDEAQLALLCEGREDVPNALSWGTA
ncbi:MAG: hypothetical protein NVSMB29_01990 [Candidatus Dormibacteria bacterium]